MIQSDYNVIDLAIETGQEKMIAASYGALCHFIVLTLEWQTSRSESESRVLSALGLLQKEAKKDLQNIPSGVCDVLKVAVAHR